MARAINQVILVLSLLTSLLLSETEYGAEGSKIAKVGFVGAQFLKIEVGARGFAMGDAVDPIVDDASAVFWNPAGLTRIKGKNFFSVKTNWLAGISHRAAAFSMKSPIMPGILALSYVSLGTDDMKETTILQQNGTGNTFRVENFAIGVAYAASFTHKFSFGLHWKLINEDYVVDLPGVPNDFGSAKTWAIDVGTLYHTDYKNLTIGMSIRNFGPEAQMSGSYFDFENGDTVKTDEGDPEELNFKSHGLPLIFRFGIAADPQINEQMQLIISIVGEHPADNLERVNLGAEIRYLNYFCGRAGYIVNHDTRGPSFGFGINDFPLMSLGKLDADFAISQFSFFEPVMIFSAGLHF